jgi:hypothetical protein
MANNTQSGSELKETQIEAKKTKYEEQKDTHTQRGDKIRGTESMLRTNNEAKTSNKSHGELQGEA